MTGYEVYYNYVWLTLYLRGDHDGRSLKLPYEKYKERPDKGSFDAVAAEVQFPYKRILSNIIADRKHISAMIGRDAERAENLWRGRTDGLSYLVTSELKRHCVPLEPAIRCVPNRHPQLFSKLLSQTVSMETATVLQSVVGFADDWTQVMGDDHVWREHRYRVERYNRLINYDRNGVEAAVRDIVGHI